MTLGAAGTLTKSVGNVLAADFDGLTPGLTYSFRVRAENAAGSSGWSNTVSATTLATNRVKVPGVGYVPVRAWGKSSRAGLAAADRVEAAVWLRGRLPHIAGPHH